MGDILFVNEPVTRTHCLAFDAVAARIDDVRDCFDYSVRQRLQILVQRVAEVDRDAVLAFHRNDISTPAPGTRGSRRIRTDNRQLAKLLLYRWS